jgi:hypothetical protein
MIIAVNTRDVSREKILLKNKQESNRQEERALPMDVYHDIHVFIICGVAEFFNRSFAHPSATSNQSSILQSSSVTILATRSVDSAGAALSSARARRVMVVDDTPA